MYHTLYLEITRRCNFSCPYCSAGSNDVNKWEEEKSVSEIIEHILKPAKKIGTNVVVFSGGEPLLYHDFYNLVAETVKLGLRFAIATNGYYLTQDVIDKLLKIAGNSFVISLGINSFDENNKETRTKELDFFLSKLNLLLRNNISVNISITVGSFNCDTFQSTVKKVTEMGLPYNRIPFAPRNSNNRQFMFNKKMMKEKIHPVYVSCYNGFTSFTPFFLSEESYRKITGSIERTQVPLNPSVGCWVGSFYAINPSGEVAPCPLLSDNISAGNVYYTSLESILFDSDLMKKITNRENLKGKCGGCRYNWTCGGCRTMAFYQSGDVFNEDPTCFIDELSESEIIELEQITEKHFKNYYRMYLLSKTFG